MGWSVVLFCLFLLRDPLEANDSDQHLIVSGYAVDISNSTRELIERFDGMLNSSGRSKIAVFFNNGTFIIGVIPSNDSSETIPNDFQQNLQLANLTLSSESCHGWLKRLNIEQSKLRFTIKCDPNISYIDSNLMNTNNSEFVSSPFEEGKLRSAPIAHYRGHGRVHHYGHYGYRHHYHGGMGLYSPLYVYPYYSYYPYYNEPVVYVDRRSDNGTETYATSSFSYDTFGFILLMVMLFITCICCMHGCCCHFGRYDDAEEMVEVYDGPPAFLPPPEYPMAPGYPGYQVQYVEAPFNPMDQPPAGYIVQDVPEQQQAVIQPGHAAKPSPKQTPSVP